MQVFKKGRFTEGAARGLAGIAVLCLLLRTVYLYQLKSTPLFGLFATDSFHYDKFALRFLEGNFTFRDTIFLNPLYPVFLALIYRILGHNFIAVALIQILLDTVTCVFLYLISLRLFNNKGMGLLASLIYAFYAIAIFNTGFLLSTTLVTFLYVALILSLISAKDAKSGSRLWFLSGMLIGLSALLRANIILFLPFLILWLFCFVKKNGLGKKVGLISIGIFVTMLPFSARNYAIEKRISPFPAHGGINFYMGNNPFATGTYMPLHGISGFPVRQVESSIIMARDETGRNLTASEASDYWFLRGLRFIRDNPRAYISLLIKKFLLFWNREEIGGNLNYYFCKRFIPFLNLPLLSFGIVAPFAIAGFIFAARQKPDNIFLVISFIVTYTASLMLYFVTSRHRFPCVPFIIIFSAYSIYNLAYLIKSSNARGLTLFIIILSASFFIVNRPILGGLGKGEFFVEHNNLGLVYLRQGEPDKAIAECRKAIEINPDFPEAHARLGDIYSDKSLYDEAVREYRQAVKLYPSYAEAHDNLGVAYFKQGRIEDAIDEYRKAIEINPDYYPSAYSNLGLAYYKKGLIDEAVAAYKKSISVDPGYPDAYNNLGILYIKEGMLDEAIRELEEGVSSGTEYAEVYYNLGIAYFKKNMPQKAISLYKKALEIAPGYAAAYNNLAAAFFYMKEYRLAVEYIDKAEKLGYGNAELSEALKPYRSKAEAVE